jgi:UDPglucose--hexose-1-phosphate uridylyltransferase
MSRAGELIEEIILFGLKSELIENLDIPQVRNQLLSLLKVEEPSIGYKAEFNDKYPVNILNRVIDDAVQRGVIEDSLSERDILDAKIMAQLLPRQSELNCIYEGIKISDGGVAATDYYYNLSKVSNYIRTDRISKNRYWKTNSSYGDLEITINLSKPEKDPKDIAAAGKVTHSNYPKCLLCLENVGFDGHVSHPARANHRVLPLTLNREEWYFQYSPYVYYNEHAIIFKGAHEPMRISKESFIRLTDFTEVMPHYFIGSNADLPIVGGSILSHDHFQGGKHRFPMVDAKPLKKYKSEKYDQVNISIVQWPMSVIRISSKDKLSIVDFATEILDSWRDYSDSDAGITSFSMINNEAVAHNTITPISRINDEGLFELDLVLRNNRCDKDHPDGIYHPHKHLHHIKKENIGLIEVMGLAILPARIEKDLKILSKVLQGSEDMKYVEDNMENHLEWFKEIFNHYGGDLDEVSADSTLQDAVGKRFSEVLECAGVYKLNDDGLNAFSKFLISMECLEI